MLIYLNFVLTGSIELHHFCDHLCNQKMFDVLWMMDDVLRDVRCMMAEGRCVISLFHSHLVSYIYAQVP